MSKARALLLLVLASGPPPGGAVPAAPEIVAVVSGADTPYREAFDAFQETVGRPVPLVNMEVAAPRVVPGTRVVVAFGGEAADRSYPPRTALVVALAPGLDAAALRHGGPVSTVAMCPEPAALIAAIKNVQPALKTLAVLWTLESYNPTMAALENAGKAAGVAILGRRIGDVGRLPQELRGLHGKADAFWIPPDPALISPQTFELLKSFSWTNDLPFYAPTAGLVEKGATASFCSNFRQMGQESARAALARLEGRPVPPVLHAPELEATVNLSAAAQAGLAIPAAALEKIQRKLP